MDMAITILYYNFANYGKFRINDGLTVLADTTDCVSVNHIIWKFSDGWLVTSLPFICG